MLLFIFKALSVIFLFSFMVNILYYYGVMQLIVQKVGWFLQVSVGTTATESINCAANIFLGQVYNSHQIYKTFYSTTI